MIQGILTGVRRRDIILMLLAKVNGMPLVEQWDGKSIPVIVGNNLGCDEIQNECWRKAIPYLYIDHGYFVRGYDNQTFRFCWNHYHQTDWENLADKKVPKYSDWRPGGHILVLPPSKLVSQIYGAGYWLDETMDTLSRNTDRKLIIKLKGQGDFTQMLKGAHAVVSYGSVAEVEAIMSGVPVFTTAGPSYMIASNDFSRIETPIYADHPQRWKWLKALASAEWHLDELNKAWSHLYGNQHLR